MTFNNRRIDHRSVALQGDVQVHLRHREFGGPWCRLRIALNEGDVGEKK
jgi:hypothetical protein